MNHIEPVQIHIPLNLVFQETGDKGLFAGVFQFKFDGLGAQRIQGLVGNKSHLLTCGDAVLRVTESHASDSLRGIGVSGIYRDGFLSMGREMREEANIKPKRKKK